MKKNMQIPKLVIVTREDISRGYQAQQSTHSVADFAIKYPIEHIKWSKESGSIILLSIKNEKDLLSLYNKLIKNNINVALFQEPDLNDEYTSLCFYSDYGRKFVSHLPLLGKEKSISDILYDMSVTMQTDTQSVLEHGISVNNYYKDLVSLLKNNKSKYEWRLPSWLNVDLLSEIYDDEILFEYHLLHDIGKPYCLVIDSDGKRHYPDHANKSHEVYTKYFNNNIVSELIKSDMVIHLMKPSEVDDFIDGYDYMTIYTLLITALCELHSNASMFGGKESVSFKIKFKSLEKVGSKIIQKIKEKYEKVN